jgi:hypothetical protein
MKIQLHYLLSIALLFTTGVTAQDNKLTDPSESNELNTEAYIQLLRQEVRIERQSLIRAGMQLDEKQGTAFWPIYKTYAAEQVKLGDERLAIIKDYSDHFLTMNDANAERLAAQIMTLDERRIALRRKYFQLMKSALSTVLVVRFFQLDQQIQLIIDLRIAANLPIIEKRGAE